MDTNQPEFQEERLRQWSQGFPYPPTPDIAGAVRQQLKDEEKVRFFPRPRLARVAVIILLLATLMAVPRVRAQVLEFLQVGVIRIFLTEPTPTPSPGDSELLPSAEGLNSQTIVTATLLSPTKIYPSIEDLAGETTLEDAQNELAFSIRLPSYPKDLGTPDRVFLQDFGGPAVLLVWIDPMHPERIRMNLLILGPGTFGQKAPPAIIEETSVHGQRAIWTEGAHFLHLGGSMYQNVTLVVDGNLLIWEQDGLTYRLETDLSLAEAVKVAESLE
jgi:hypothetical protein